MVASLSLLLCAAYVLVLLGLERKGARGVSTALWIPTAWMLVSASRPLASWFVSPGHVISQNDSGSPLDKWVLTGLAVAAIVVLIYRRLNWWRNLRQHKWLVALLAYMFLSTFWSAITVIALRRWTRELIFVAMALVIVTETNPRHSLASVFRRCAYVLLPLSVVLIKYYPLLGRQYGRYSGIETWTGVASQKNSLGRLCMISIFFLLWALYERWRKHHPILRSGHAWADISVILLGLYLLIGSRSSTALATLLLGILLYLSFSLLRKLKIPVPQTALLILTLVFIAFGLSAPFLGGTNVAQFSSSLGRDDTLTGRTEVWADVMPAMKQEPVLGYGFGSFWTDARRQLYDIPTAHNGYLDVLLELGAVGLVFEIVWLISCARQSHRALSRDYDWASLALCLLLMGLVYNTTESTLDSLTEHMTAVIMLTSFVSAQLARSSTATEAAKTKTSSNSKFGTKDADWKWRSHWSTAPTSSDR